MRRVLGYLGVVLVLFGGSAWANLVNGGFETGDFTGWDRYEAEDTFVVDASFGSGPTEGTYEAALRTPLDELTNLCPLSAFVGVDLCDFFSLGNGIPVEGTAIRQTFHASAGDVLEFDYNFLTNCPTPEQLCGLDNDFGFVVLGGLDELADAYDADNISATPFDLETGFQTHSTVIPVTGWYVLNIGVMDVLPANACGVWDESAILIDNAYVGPVPEPSTLILLGLGGLAGLVRRMRCRM